MAVANRTLLSAQKVCDELSIKRVSGCVCASWSQTVRQGRLDRIEHACEFATLYIEQAVKDWRDIIGDKEIDAVVFGTWPYLHRTLILLALQAGKHVLTEARLVSRDSTALHPCCTCALHEAGAVHATNASTL